MNKTFKVIFSKTRGALVAVNEAAKTTSRASVKTAVAGVCAALLSVPAMAEGFTDYCQNGQCDVVGKTVEGKGSVVQLDSSTVQSITIKDSKISNTIFKLSGSQKISVSDTVFTGLVSKTPGGFGIYAHNGYTTDVANEKATEVELNNVTFTDNTVSYGSLFVYDKTKLHMKGGAFVKNMTTDIGGGARSSPAPSSLKMFCFRTMWQRMNPDSRQAELSTLTSRPALSKTRKIRSEM